MIPENFIKRSALLFDSNAEHEKFIGALSGEPVRALRVNSIKTEAADFEKNAAFALDKLDFCGGYRFYEEKIGTDPLHHAGAYYVQDPSAMCAVKAAKQYIRPDFAVLDMCAAPGGKSTQIAALLEDGFLVSNEIDRKRCAVLRQNTERMGHRRTVVTCAPPQRIAADFPRAFDLVITDAPCSGEGMLRKYGEAAENWSEENVLMCAERQRDILECAEKCVAPGGYLLYSTCTFSLEENEMTVDSFLSRHGGYSVVSADSAVKANTADGINFKGCRFDMSECRRFYPHISQGEGQFICIMKRDCSGSRGAFSDKKSAARPIPKNDVKIVDEFLALSISEKCFPFMLRDTVMLGEGLPCPEYVLCCGVAAGQVIKGRFEPHHHLFSAYGNSFVKKVELESGSPEVQAYLRGESINIGGSADRRGWCAVTIDKCAAGGGKIVGDTLKNHYPKGLRIRKQAND